MASDNTDPSEGTASPSDVSDLFGRDLKKELLGSYEVRYVFLHKN